MSSLSNFPISHPIEIVHNNNINRWEDLWRIARNGTLFHSPRFLSYHKPGKFNNHHLEFYRKGNLIAIMPCALQDEDDGTALASYPGASYGGPAWVDSLRYHHILGIVTELVAYARAQKWKRIRLTPPPIIYSEHPEQPLDFALLASGFKPIRCELTQAVKLDFDPDTLLSSFVNKTRTGFRKAEKSGLKFRVIENPTEYEFKRFYEILVENRAGLGVVPAHSLEDIIKLHDLVPENLMMAVIERNGTIISEIWNFICNDRTVLEFYMAHLVEEQHLRPVPFLTYHTMLWAREKGFRWLDFGISSIDSEPTWGLLKFKENFGSRHFLRQTWQLEL